jgi:hypothetical protein
MSNISRPADMAIIEPRSTTGIADTCFQVKQGDCQGIVIRVQLA